MAFFAIPIQAFALLEIWSSYRVDRKINEIARKEELETIATKISIKVGHCPEKPQSRPTGPLCTPEPHLLLCLIRQASTQTLPCLVAAVSAMRLKQTAPSNDGKRH
jgi:hypothetical protein